MKDTLELNRSDKRKSMEKILLKQNMKKILKTLALLSSISYRIGIIFLCLQTLHKILVGTLCQFNLCKPNN